MWSQNAARKGTSDQHFDVDAFVLLQKKRINASLFIDSLKLPRYSFV
ncbi:MAG: hypothetical protein UZ08_BCD001001618 [Candidatus Parvibacillus calidus]|nr:MAG: hypothetical protein UZ08_BCD001001618 [Candidatus Parvibacillus calidus]